MRPTLAVFFIGWAAASAHAGDLIPTDPRFGPLRVASHQVEVTVDNQVAVTRVEQVFANDHPATLEAHYTFPVPKNASLIDFSMTVGGKLVRGELLEKDRARSIYESIVRQSRDPGLLEHVGANIFRVRVFPILPGTSQKIEMTYVERVNYDSGTCRLVYPLLVPGGKPGTKTDRFSYRFRLASAVPIQDLASSTHRIGVVRKTEQEAEALFDGSQIDLSKDLEITYRIARQKSGMDLVTHRPKGQEGTFLLLITPEANPEPVAKDMTFVFDTSGSMEGKRIKQAKAALRYCLAKLRPEDRFNILTFSSDVVEFEKSHVPATDEAKARAEKFIQAMDASGATNINDALLRALEHRPADGRTHLVLFMTDGQPTVGETRPAAIVENVLRRNPSQARIFTFGVGEDLNHALLEELSDGTHGVSEYVAETEDIEVKVSRLQRKIAQPVFSDLALEWGDAEVSAVYPKSPGDLYAGTQLAVSGRYRKAGTFSVTLKGRAGTREIRLQEKLTFPETRDESSALLYLWATRKVATLLDQIRRLGENPELVTEIVALAKAHRIATPYTSFLVLESEAAYDQRGIDRKGAQWQPPGATGKATFQANPESFNARIRPPDRPGLSLMRERDERKGIPRDDSASRPTDEPAIFFPEAKESDHNESADNEDYHRMKGDSKDFLSYIKGEAEGSRGRQAGRTPGVYDVMGVGQGGGRYGSRFGGRESLVARGGGSRATESAVLSALKWLARHQGPDGSWSAEGFRALCAGERCSGTGEKDHEMGLTSLSLLAFLGTGYTQLSRDEYPDPAVPGRFLKFGETVKKALQWILSHQDPEGCLGERGPKHLYGHALGTLALSEAYGMTGSLLLREPAQKALDFLVLAQNPGQGWRYSARSGDSDTSVSGWAAQVLESAKLSGLSYPLSCSIGLRSWLDQVTDESKKFEVGYLRKGAAKVFVPGKNESFDSHPTMSAIGIFSRRLLGSPPADRTMAAVELLGSDLPKWAPNAVDFYYWYFGTQALYSQEGPEGALWKKWNEALKNALLPQQKTAKDGCAGGSWDPSAERWGFEGGRVYTTALAALTLEVYYRRTPSAPPASPK